MPNFTYNRDIPDAPNNPSVDQPPMRVNTNSIDDLIDIDHYAFNDNNGGLHKQVTMVNISAPGFPNGGDGLLFAGVNIGNSWPHWQNALGSVLLINRVPQVTTNGFVSLPGGLIMQWGAKSAPGSAGTINFIAEGCITFPTNIFTVQLTAQSTSASVVILSNSSPPSTSGFTYAATTSMNVLHWFAIGN